MNASFGTKDGLQLLQTVADGSRYESANMAKLPELVANCSKQLMHELGHVLDKGKGKG